MLQFPDIRITMVYIMDYLGHELLNGQYIKYWYEIYRSILALQRIKVKVAIIMLFNLLAFKQGVIMQYFMLFIALCTFF